MLKRIAFVASTLLATICAFWVADVLEDQKMGVLFEAPTPLYSLPPHEYPTTNPTLEMVRSGLTLKVLRVRFGKDFETLKVETPEGKVGWVIGGKKSVKVVAR